jgi:hypothetical protein
LPRRADFRGFQVTFEAFDSVAEAQPVSYRAQPLFSEQPRSRRDERSDAWEKS